MVCLMRRQHYGCRCQHRCPFSQPKRCTATSCKQVCDMSTMLLIACLKKPWLWQTRYIVTLPSSMMLSRFARKLHCSCQCFALRFAWSGLTSITSSRLSTANIATAEHQFEGRPCTMSVLHPFPVIDSADISCIHCVTACNTGKKVSLAVF